MDTPNTSIFDEQFQNYVKLVVRFQALSDPNGYTVQKMNSDNTNNNNTNNNCINQKFIIAADLGSCENVGYAVRVHCEYYGINRPECDSTGVVDSDTIATDLNCVTSNVWKKKWE